MKNLYGPYTTADAAATSGNRNLPTRVLGELLEIKVSIVGGSAVTVTVATVPQSGDIAGPVTLLNVTGLAAGNYSYYVRKQACDSAGAALAGVYEEYVIESVVNISHVSTGSSTVSVTLVTEGD